MRVTGPTCKQEGAIGWVEILSHNTRKVNRLPFQKMQINFYVCCNNIKMLWPGPLIVLSESSERESEKIQKTKTQKEQWQPDSASSQYAQHCVKSIIIMSLSWLVLLSSFSLGVVTTPLCTGTSSSATAQQYLDDYSSISLYQTAYIKAMHKPDTFQLLKMYITKPAETHA